MQAKEVAYLAARVKENISRVIVGKSDMMDMMLSAVIARGHVLLEDVPGTGKTVTARALAKSLQCDFARVQFTPDLLPSDVTGTRVYQPAKGEFEFHKGPVFTHILLADEINRATPRTQSALLECMEERQVTEGGVTRKLSEPFLVIATQTPVEIQGTFPLPEAQLDRFLLRLTPGYPNKEESVQILSRFLNASPLEMLQSVCEKAEIVAAQQSLSACEASRPVQEYIVALCESTRRNENAQLGVSPRGMLALMRACQAYALIQGRSFVTPDDVQKLAVPVLAHRVIARGLYGKSGTGESIVQKALQETPVPTEEA